jgi:Transposase DDE domain
MPEPLWIYLTALLYFTEVSPCVAIAQALQHASHDRLTRMLAGDWSGQTLLEHALRALFTVVGGDLVVEDPVWEKPDATCLTEAAWVWSSKQNKVVLGIPLVLLVWTAGHVRIPLAFRVWQKGGPSTFELAWEWLSDARHRRRCTPRWVLFASWSPSKKLLKRSRDDGWYVVGQLKKNRRFEGQPLNVYRRHPYWRAMGHWAGGIKVGVVRSRRQYYVTNRLSLTAVAGRTIDKERHESEDVFTMLKSQVSVEACQAGDKRVLQKKSQAKEGPQAHHLALCLVAYLIAERERCDQGVTLRQLRRSLILKGLKVPLPSLQRLRMAA